jgi:protein tyrosine phosphatase (PTP) superfamily phosphohydrolase (DUF442 family)
MKSPHVLLIALLCGGGHASERTRPAGPGASIELAAIPNAFELPGGVVSGSSPEGEEGFAALAARGIKVIVSVDGARPRVDLAEKYGMRYVHLPIGYDSVPPERVAQLVKAANEAPGAVFLHCHHGQHRGPAAAAVICQARAGWSPEEAVRWLEQAGTADEYAGLYRSVREFQKPDAGALARVGPLPSVAETTPGVQAMVAMDEALHQLKASQRRDWREVPGYRAVAPVAVAASLWQAVRGLGRHPESVAWSEEYRQLMFQCEDAAAALRDVLGDATAPHGLRTEALRRLEKTCAACHKNHRN